MQQSETPLCADMAAAHAAPTSGASASVLPLPIGVMARFRRLMEYEGWAVDVSRMCVDTAYAYGCLATAHGSSDERLRRTALVLFEAYDRNNGGNNSAALVH